MSGKPDEKSEMMIEDKQEIQGEKSSISKSRILFLILVVIAFVVLIIGIVLIALSFKKKDCAQNDDGEEKQQAQVSGEQTLSSFCEYSEEAKRIGLHDILVRAKKSYYEYNPFLLTSDPDATRDEIKEKYTAGADPGGGCRGCAPPPGMTCGRFLINTVQSLDRHTKSALSFDMYSQQFTLCYVLVKSPLLRIRF